MNQRKAYFYAGTAVFFWSTVASAFKIALQYQGVLNLLLYSSVTTVIVLFFILVAQNKFRQVFSFSPSLYLRSVLLGIINPFVYYIILLTSYDLLPAQVAQPVNMVWPIVLVFFSMILLKQKIAIKSILALFVSCIGVFFISSQGNLSEFHSSDPVGIALALFSTIIWSIFWIYNVKDTRDEVIKLFLNFVFATLFILAANVLFTGIQFPGVKGTLAAMYIGCFEMGITFVFWLKAMKFSKSNDKIGNLVFFAPFLSLVFIHFLIHETIFYTTIVGLVLIIIGVFIQQIKKEKVR